MADVTKPSPGAGGGSDGANKTVSERDAEKSQVEGARVDASSSASFDQEAPSLLDAAGNPLPQTEDRPSAESGVLHRRLELLTRAIAENAPEIALPAFFPVEAYVQVKAIEHPERDHQKRLVAAFERNIADYHKQLGPTAEQARFVRLEVPDVSVKWMKPGSEGNRVGYYRVLRSKLVVGVADGTERAFEVTSMISWRGEWYVVHLNGFK